MSYEPDVDDEQYRGTQILWGRVLVLLLALALAFWLGTTFGGDASVQRQVSDQRAEIARLEAQVASLEASLAAVDAGGGDRPSEAPSDIARAASSRRDADGGRREGETERPSEPATDDEQESGRQYVIQSGDSLAAIAQEVYGDPTRWRDIARANDLSEPYALTVGEELQIPPGP